MKLFIFDIGFLIPALITLSIPLLLLLWASGFKITKREWKFALYSALTLAMVATLFNMSQTVMDYFSAFVAQTGLAGYSAFITIISVVSVFIVSTFKGVDTIGTGKQRLMFLLKLAVLVLITEYVLSQTNIPVLSVVGAI